MSPDRPLDHKKVRRGYYNVEREYDYWVPSADIVGEIPPSLHGTLYRNGPGLMEVYGTKLVHRECFACKNIVNYHAGGLEIAVMSLSPLPLSLM